MKGGYRLTDEALKIINKPAMRRELMDILEVTEFTIARYIQKNNPILTEYAVLELINQESGLTIGEMLKGKNYSDIKTNTSFSYGLFYRRKTERISTKDRNKNA